MQRRLYDEYQIELLRKQYKWYRWGLTFGSILPSLSILLILVFDIEGIPDWNYGFYDNKGVYHYIAARFLLLCILSPVFIAFGELFLRAIYKKIFKEKYHEFLVARKGKNINQSIWERVFNITGYVFATALIIWQVLLLPRLDLYESDICINGRHRSNGNYRYSEFKIIFLSEDEYSRDLGFKMGNDNYIFFDIGNKSPYQTELLKLLDEKTEYRFKLLGQSMQIKSDQD